MGDAAEVTESDFQAEVLESDVPVLVDFWGAHCAPCRAIAPVIDGLARENAGRAKVVKVNVNNYPRVAANYQIDAIPAFLVFKKGQVVASFRGAPVGLKAKLQAALDQAQG